MKNKINMKDLNTGYLYRDGHFIAFHEKITRVRGLRLRSNWIEAYEDIGVKVNFPDDGRLIFHNAGAVYLLRHPDLMEIRATLASVDRGSDATKKLGLEVGYIELRFKGTFNTLIINQMPKVISNDIYYQSFSNDLNTNTNEKWEEVLNGNWSGTEKIIHKKEV